MYFEGIMSTANITSDCGIRILPGEHSTTLSAEFAKLTEGG